jgi:hypothetical protein
MTNCIFGWPRWTEETTWGGGSFNATYPRTNLGTLPLSRVARTSSASLANAQFTGVVPKDRAFRHAAFVGHNMTAAAKYRFRLYSDTALTTVVYDSGWVDVWPVVYPASEIEWEDDNWWTGKYSTEEMAGYVWTTVIWLDRLYLARGFKAEIDDTGNPDGYVQIGLFEVGAGWLASVNFEYGTEYGFRFRSRVVESDGGVRYFERRAKPRVLRGAISAIDRDEALARGFEIQRQADIDKPFLWVPDADDAVHRLRTAFLARNVDPGLFRYASAGVDAVPIAIEEVL